MQVSVIIPTFNRAELLQTTLASVFTQRGPAREVIVVDDGSTDDAPPLLGPFLPRVRHVRQARSGIGAARNHGVAVASGDFLAFLDNDDLWEPDKIERHLAFAAAHPEWAVTYTDAIEFSQKGPDPQPFSQKFPAIQDPRHLFAPMITEYAIPLVSTIMVRSAFLR